MSNRIQTHQKTTEVYEGIKYDGSNLDEVVEFIETVYRRGVYVAHWSEKKGAQRLEMDGGLEIEIEVGNYLQIVPDGEGEGYTNLGVFANLEELEYEYEILEYNEEKETPFKKKQLTTTTN
tara:strand:+ start:539 stop:901 length:363 start_codon:yes stop_codon:yes gene_type:complete